MTNFAEHNLPMSKETTKWGQRISKQVYSSKFTRVYGSCTGMMGEHKPTNIGKPQILVYIHPSCWFKGNQFEYMMGQYIYGFKGKSKPETIDVPMKYGA